MAAANNAVVVASASAAASSMTVVHDLTTSDDDNDSDKNYAKIHEQEQAHQICNSKKRSFVDLSDSNDTPSKAFRAESELDAVFGRTFQPLPGFEPDDDDDSTEKETNTFVGKTDPNERHAANNSHEQVAAEGKTDPNERPSLQEVIDVDADDETTPPPSTGSKGTEAQPKNQESLDRLVARQLQDKMDKELRQQEEQEMCGTVTGRAYKFVERVLNLHAKVCATYSSLPVQYAAPVAFDDMVFTTEKTMTMQQEFAHAGKPHNVDIGYHYTKEENLARIQENGLLSRAEREQHNIVSKFNGSVHGDGIYTGKNPFAFHGQSYGNVGLVVARLLGDTQPSWVHRDFLYGHDTVIAFGGTHKEIAVLKKSAQCIPIIRYDADLVDKNDCAGEGNKVVDTYVLALGKLIDEFFNKDGIVVQPQTQATAPQDQQAGPSNSDPSSRALSNHRRTAAVSTYSSGGLFKRMPGGSVWVAPSVAAASHSTPSVAAAAMYPAPPVSSNVYIGSSHYVAPESLDGTFNIDAALQDVKNNKDSCKQECPICLDLLFTGGQQAVCLKACGHEFHSSCIKDALTKQSPSCPICRKLLHHPQGKMPTGTMTVTYSPDLTCSGHEPGTIVVQYSIQGGVQKCYHDNTGQRHPGTSRTAYLPNNKDGQKLLMRLYYAFQHGLTFTVGRSLTTGRANCVTWSSIHHKTTTRGGPHGFPDPSFFMNCNEELNALGVPPADDL